MCINFKIFQKLFQNAQELMNLKISNVWKSVQQACKTQNTHFWNNQNVMVIWDHGTSCTFAIASYNKRKASCNRSRANQITRSLHWRESQLFRHVASIFRGVRFNNETEQTRPKVQLSRGKIGLSETTLRIWIFFNFFELPSDSFSLFRSFFFTKTTYFYNFRE